MTSETIDTHQKAIILNLDPRIYGTFAEIGAGQEIARWFFRVGGAAGTVAKTMSAYDMTFSDAIYGKSERYVSRNKLEKMLDHEYKLLIERLGEARGKETTFFSFADTVSAKNYKGTNQCHGWLGLRFQSEPGQPPSDILMHVNMLDGTNLQQQEALGILGVNLLYAAYYRRETAEATIKSLLDGLSIERIEIDLLHFAGPAFKYVDNRLVGVLLLQAGLANAIIYDPDGNLLQPSDEVYKRRVMVERGTFRALHQMSAKHVETAHREFAGMAKNNERETVSVLEISVNEVLGREALSPAEILDRVDDLWKLGYRVMVTRFREFFELSSYLRRYTQESIGFLMGVSTFAQLFNERFYSGSGGRLLEGIARLFSHDVSLFVYPMSRSDFESRVPRDQPGSIEVRKDAPADPVKVDNLDFPAPVNHLYCYLRETGWIHTLQP